MRTPSRLVGDGENFIANRKASHIRADGGDDARAITAQHEWKFELDALLGVTLRDFRINRD